MKKRLIKEVKKAGGDWDYIILTLTAFAIISLTLVWLLLQVAMNPSIDSAGSRTAPRDDIETLR